MVRGRVGGGHAFSLQHEPHQCPTSRGMFSISNRFKATSLLSSLRRQEAMRAMAVLPCHARKNDARLEHHITLRARGNQSLAKVTHLFKEVLGAHALIQNCNKLQT